MILAQSKITKKYSKKFQNVMNLLFGCHSVRTFRMSSNVHSIVSNKLETSMTFYDVHWSCTGITTKLMLIG